MSPCPEAPGRQGCAARLHAGLLARAVPGSCGCQLGASQETGINPPGWWWEALQSSGLVLKPQRGHAGRAVIRFRWTDGRLEQEALFRHLPAQGERWPGHGPPAPDQMLAHWRRLCRTDEAAIAAPYLTHSATLPAAEPSVVVRVITTQASPDGPVGVLEAWLEVPLGERAVAFLSTSGMCLPNPGEPLCADEQASLERWQRLLPGDGAYRIAWKPA
jgi:hypothetical protein